MICNIFSNLSFIGPFLGNCHCRKLGPSIEKFLVSLVSPSGRLPSSVKDQLACWLSRNFTFLRFSFLLLSIACWPWCCKNSFFVILFLSVISNESSSSDKSFCDFYVNHPESIFNQNKQPKKKWFFLFSKYLLWIGSFYKKFLIFKVSVGLAPVELLNSSLLVSINVFAHFCRWMSSYLREINTCQIILKFWIKDKCQ